MTYFHKEGETNQQREARLAAEYETYAADLRTQKIEPVNYMNWLASKKYQEPQE